MADEHLLTDLRLKLRRNELRPVYAIDTEQQRLKGSRVVLEDVETISGRDNLAQAIIIRLLTPRGELSALGHPEYGSRLHELIGMQNTETTRNLAKVYILEALTQEARIDSVSELVITPAAGTRDRVNVRLVILPVAPPEVSIRDVATLTIGPFTLALD